MSTRFSDREYEALREENARLLATSVRLHKERDDLAIEVKRLEGLILRWSFNDGKTTGCIDALLAEARRIRAAAKGE